MLGARYMESKALMQYCPSSPGGRLIAQEMLGLLSAGAIHRAQFRDYWVFCPGLEFRHPQYSLGSGPGDSLAPSLTVVGFPSFFLWLKLRPLAVEKDMLPFSLSHVTSAHTVVGMIFTVGKSFFQFYGSNRLAHILYQLHIVREKDGIWFAPNHTRVASSF